MSFFKKFRHPNWAKTHAPDYTMGEGKTSPDHLAIGKWQRLIQRLVALYDSGGEYFECGGSSSAHSFLVDFFQWLVEGDETIYMRLPHLLECAEVC